MFRRSLRLILTGVGVLAGFSLTFFGLDQVPFFGAVSDNTLLMVVVLLLGSALGGLIGFMLHPVVNWMEGRLSKTPLLDIIFGAAGLIVGLIIATLLSLAIREVQWLGPLMAALGALVFGYLGMTIAARKREELESFLGAVLAGRRGARSAGPAPAPVGGIPKILDTSVIIDGRIADIVRTGFLEGPLIIPSVVLEELQHIADSSDVLKRNRGRRGLDILAQMQKEKGVQVQIYEEDLGEGEVDTKLLRLARTLGGKIITNDYNLNKVAELQGVPVLNINELANAVKPAVLPGEEMTVTIIKDGKEPGQGVAYLDDGTMIVVDGGRRYMGETITVLVTSVLQTSAGRMIFARPRGGEHRGDRGAERERVAP
ncbi:MAG: PIN/TRAM domain-containing protein [Bacillota bacterium]|nr:MAG: PIN domain nuclease [Bacillota bacterium]